jgi:IS30 family transposase
VEDAITSTIALLPEHLRRSLTWNRGAAMSEDDQLSIDTGVRLYFSDPESPWQRGMNENTNILLRQHFPKETYLSRHSKEDITAVALTLTRGPRKTLGWRTPAEALDEHLLPSPEQVLPGSPESAQITSGDFATRLQAKNSKINDQAGSAATTISW